MKHPHLSPRKSGTFVLQEMGILLGGCLTCEELVGGYSQWMMGLVLKGISD